jgi:hypothetical protein
MRMKKEEIGNENKENTCKVIFSGQDSTKGCFKNTGFKRMINRNKFLNSGIKDTAAVDLDLNSLASHTIYKPKPSNDEF